MDGSGNGKQWFAFYLRSRAEKAVARRLAEAGEEVFLPLHKTLKLWKDRKKWVEEPLIRSYIFVRVPPHHIIRVLHQEGVVKVVHFSGHPAPIPDNQIEALRIALISGCEIEASEEDFTKGDRIEITRGPLAGISGLLVELQGKYRLVIQIDNLNYAVLVTLHPNLVKKLPKT